MSSFIVTPGLFGITILLALLTIGMLAVVIYSTIRNKNAPVKRVPAVVLRRRTREHGIDMPLNPLPFLLNIFSLPVGWFRMYHHRNRIGLDHMARLSGEITIAESANRFITFGVQGDEIELLVPEGMFMSLQDGEQGTLVYQGEIFKHFMRNTNQPTA